MNEARSGGDGRSHLVFPYNGAIHYKYDDGQVSDREYAISIEAVLATDWQRVPPPTPRQIYLMVPCEKGKGTHMKDRDDELCCCSRSEAEHDYRQVPMPLTVEDLAGFNRLITFASSTCLPSTIDRMNRVRETLKLMKGEA